MCQPLWKDPTPSLGEPAIAAGRVYVPRYTSGSSISPGVDVYDEAGVTGCTGSPKVCQPEFSLAAASNGSEVSVSEGQAYVRAPSTSSSLLEAFDANGVTGCTGTPVVCQPLWSAGAPPVDSRSNNPPTVADGRVMVVGGGDIGVYAATAASCAGTPPTCLDYVDTLVASQTSPVVTNGLVVTGNQIFDVAGIAGCSGSPVTQCSPLKTLPVTVAPGQTTTVSNAAMWLPGTDGEIHTFQVS